MRNQRARDGFVKKAVFNNADDLEIVVGEANTKAVQNPIFV
jgi:hypothetical protein